MPPRRVMSATPRTTASVVFMMSVGSMSTSPTSTRLGASLTRSATLVSMSTWVCSGLAAKNARDDVDDSRIARGPYRVPGFPNTMPWSIGTPITTAIPSRIAAGSTTGHWKKDGIPT